MTSAIRQLLVHLDASSRGVARLQVARQLAQGHGAALHALYAVTPSFVGVPYALEGGGNLAVEMQAVDDERRIRARMTFDEAMKKPGAPAVWSDLTEFPVIGGFARQALYADLMVLGQHDFSAREAADVPPDFVEEVIAASGKPALVIPWVGAQRDIGATVVIAWKETPQAARAVAAAMPLLQRARRVHVVTWSSALPDNAVASSPLGLETFLRAHHVEATWHRYGEEPSGLGELLLSTAFDLDADLLVMGCYGHSRAREWVLGGMSRTILQSMTLPVLMAH